MTFSSALTGTDILAMATRSLLEGGYRQVEPGSENVWSSDTARLFEDAYSVVFVVVYETWAALASGWADAQATLVELISTAVSSAEPKAWEGYLVLLTPSEVGNDMHSEVMHIRYNVSRVRKLVATGAELRYPKDVERALLPLLPLVVDDQLTERLSALDLLQGLLTQRGLQEDDVRVLLNAFHGQQSLVDALHRHLCREIP